MFSFRTELAGSIVHHILNSLTGAVQPKAVMGMYQPAAIQQQGGGASPPEVPGTNGMPAKEFIPTLQFQGQKPRY